MRYSYLTPKIFRPERWLEADPEHLRKMGRVHELVFNWGFIPFPRDLASVYNDQQILCRGKSRRFSSRVVRLKYDVKAFRRWDVTVTKSLEQPMPWYFVSKGLSGAHNPSSIEQCNVEPKTDRYNFYLYHFDPAVVNNCIIPLNYYYCLHVILYLPVYP